MTTDHTPGPWREGDRGMIEAEPRDGTLSAAVGAVAFVYGPFEAHGQANARLIAAAPELLSACELMLTVYGLRQEAPHAFETMRDAVVKARGEKP